MIAGHFGFAAAVKSKAPSVPLWALMLACQWLDVIFACLLGPHVEYLTPVAGSKPGAYGAVIISADYTHSLVGALGLSVLFGAVAWWPYGRRTGVILGSVVFSHWLLDLFMHRADMPLLPGNAADLPRLGFGLWSYPTLAMGLELVLVVVGAALYWRAAQRVAGHSAEALRRANGCGAGVLLTGLLTLGLNALGN